MATNSDLVSITKTLVNLQDARKDSTVTNEHQDAIESSSSENKSLERGDQLSRYTLEMAFLGLSSTVKENMKEMKDFLSNKISRLEKMVYTLEDVVERRLTAIESEYCSSKEVKVVSDRLSSLEENMSTAEETKEIAVILSSLEENICRETKAIAIRMSSLEENMSTVEEAKAMAVRLSSLEENMCTETKAIADRLSSLEENMSTVEETKEIAVRMSSLEENESTEEEKKAIAVRLSSLEENMSTGKKSIADSLSSLEENMSTDTKAISDRLSSLEENMSTDTKAISDRLSSLENSMVTLEEVKSIGEKLEEKLTLLAEMKGTEKHSTVKEEELISEEAIVPQCFDSACKGKNVALSNYSKTAERIGRYIDYGLYGGVVSRFPLKEEEVFQFEIEETNDEYKGYNGIAFGVIIDKMAEVEGAMSIYYNIKGTWAIRSYNSNKGRSNIYKNNVIINENAFPLDTTNLTVGTVLGLKLRRNGDVHFFLNGLDKGIAFPNVPNNVFAFVDVIYYVTKIRSV